MKNFKRVISAVIALALSASTLVAVSASKFADVDDTNNFAEAIEVLTALDVIHGYEEEGGLVFKPEGEITRAEAATMIVGALNMTEDAKAAAGTSKFTDVNEKASWATGYVNVGVAQGFINGMDDTTFAPQDNVTYAQMCVMLTLITGYGDYAKSYGGWPTGYTTMAASAGINKGVAVSNDTPLKRGQVAQMLYNAVTAPVLGISEYRLDGNSYKKMDGSGENGKFKSILSDKFDGYVVKGTVDEFPKAGEVKLIDVTSDYTKADDADRYFNKSGTAYSIQSAIIENGIDLSSSMKQQVRAILYVDANDKKHLVYATTTDSVETKEVALENPDSSKFAADAQIKIDSTKYNFEDSVDIYVNGDKYVTVSRDKTTDPYSEKYSTTGKATLAQILDAAVGDVKFAKTGSSKNYNTILVDAYIIGQVKKVSYKNDTTTVKFVGAANNIGAYDTIEISDNDIETDSVKLSVTLDGQEIELKDLQENDIIAVKTKIDTGDITASNENITILVSRETVSGRVTSAEKGKGENSFVIGGTEYAAVDKANVGLTVGEIYNKIYLDAFGRVFAYDDEEVEDTSKYAILAKVYDKTDATLVLPDGTKKTYEAKDANTLKDVKATEVTGTTPSTWKDSNVLNCVIKYTLKNGQINSASSVSRADFGTPGNGVQYKESVAKVGTVGIGTGTSVILTEGALTYKDYKSMKANEFIDEEVYVGAGFGKIGTTTTYSLVIVTEAGKDIGANTRFAVIDADGWSSGLDSDGDTVDQLKVLLNGEKTTLNFEPKYADTKGASSFTPVRGTAIFYTLDSDGLVDKFDIVTMEEIKNGISASPFDKLSTPGASKLGYTLSGSEDYKLVTGLVIKSSTNSVSLLTIPYDTVNKKAIEDKPIDVDAIETFSLADDCLIYTYDTDADVDDKDKLDAEGIILAENFKDWRITQEPGDTKIAAASGYSADNIGNVVWGFAPAVESELVARGISSSKFLQLKGEKAENNAQYALAYIVDDKVVEIYEILAD